MTLCATLPSSIPAGSDKPREPITMTPDPFYFCRLHDVCGCMTHGDVMNLAPRLDTALTQLVDHTGHKLLRPR